MIYVVTFEHTVESDSPEQAAVTALQELAEGNVTTAEVRSGDRLYHSIHTLIRNSKGITHD